MYILLLVVYILMLFLYAVEYCSCWYTVMYLYTNMYWYIHVHVHVHIHLRTVLVSHSSPLPLSPSPPSSRWYHYQITRHVAESVLMSTGEDGSYLLRDSNTNLGEFTLSVRSALTLHYYIVNKSPVIQALVRGFRH